MKLQIKITKENIPLKGITAMVIDGPESWPEIAAISNEVGEISFQVDTKGSYKVLIFVENTSEIITVNTSEALVVNM